MNYLKLILPSLAVYIPSFFFPVRSKTAGNKIPFRPPSYVFAIVWPILLLLLGISWSSLEIKRFDIYYILLIVSLGSWSVLYHFSLLFSFIDILLSLFMTIYLSYILYITKNKYNFRLLLPLLAWLAYVSVLNSYELII